MRGGGQHRALSPSPGFIQSQTGPFESSGERTVSQKALGKNECVVDPLKAGTFASLVIQASVH